MSKDAVSTHNSCFLGKIQDLYLGPSFTKYLALFLSVSIFLLGWFPHTHVESGTLLNIPGRPVQKEAPLSNKSPAFHMVLERVSKKEDPTSLRVTVNERGTLKFSVKFQGRFRIRSSVLSWWHFSTGTLVAFFKGQFYLVWVYSGKGSC